jgi:hypothetical protein
MTITKIANVIKVDLSLPSEFSHEAQEDSFVREYPGAHAWQSLDSFKKPNFVEQEPLLNDLLPPKQASG